MPRRKKTVKPKKQILGGGQLLAAAVFIGFFVLSLIILGASAGLLYAAGLISQTILSYLLDVASGFAFSLSVVLYLFGFKGYGAGNIIKTLGIGRKNISLKMIGYGVGLFFVLISVELIIGIVGQATNTSIDTNVSSLLAGAPFWFLLFIAVIEPINEEILFRGLMVPRLGIILSAVLFGSGHFSYMSTSYTPGLYVSMAIIVAVAFGCFYLLSKGQPYHAAALILLAGLLVTGYLGVDVIGAIAFGIVAGYVYKRTGSLFPGMIGHILVNTIATIAFVYSPGM